LLQIDKKNQNFSSNQDYSEIHLKKLVYKFLNQSNFEINENSTLEGVSGIDHTVDFFVKANEVDGLPARMLVKVLDFKKPAGTDVINKFEKASKDCSAMGLIVSNKFSAQAISLASRTDSLLLMSRTELLTIFATEKE
jgi:hypothetical protein